MYTRRFLTAASEFHGGRASTDGNWESLVATIASGAARRSASALYCAYGCGSDSTALRAPASASRVEMYDAGPTVQIGCAWMTTKTRGLLRWDSLRRSCAVRVRKRAIN